MNRTARAALVSAAIAAAAGCAHAADAVRSISLQLSGRSVALDPALAARVTTLAREVMATCGPNTQLHPHNFGPGAAKAPERWEQTLAQSRLHIVFERPLLTRSHLGGEVSATEIAIGFEQKDLFVGPVFTRFRGMAVEHLQCEYLPALELACLPGLAAHLPSHYRSTCSRLERGADGRIVLPPPDIAPSCS